MAKDHITITIEAHGSFGTRGTELPETRKATFIFLPIFTDRSGNIIWMDEMKNEVRENSIHKAVETALKTLAGCTLLVQSDQKPV